MDFKKRPEKNTLNYIVFFSHFINAIKFSILSDIDCVNRNHKPIVLFGEIMR